MKLKIHPSKYNHFPLGGFLIKGDSVRFWLKELQNFGFNLHETKVYAIPGTIANSVWGCLVVPLKLLADAVGKHEMCQVVFPDFYIPEKSNYTPFIGESDRKKLFSKGLYLYHPEIGFALLEPVNWSDLLQNQSPISKKMVQAQLPVFIPTEIRQFQIVPLSNDDISKKMEDKIFVKSEKMDDTPLTALEKAKLAFYDKIFEKGKDKKGEKSELMKSFDGFLEKIGKDGIFDSMLNDFDELQKRNQKEVEKLMDLFKNNPDEALKYAIPLDEQGVGRGGELEPGSFQLSKRWSGFSLFGNKVGSNSGGGYIDMGDRYDDLKEQYQKTALDFVDKKEYEKAAFVYLKLLKQPGTAAQTLELGKLYQEAAVIYLDVPNKYKAADCYEKGNMIGKAMELNIEIEKWEKVGDLNMIIQKEKIAFEYYEKAIVELKEKHRYEDAAVLYFGKLKDKARSQKTLLDGWEKTLRSNCLKLYFSNIDDSKELKKAYKAVYQDKVNNKNQNAYLKILQSEFQKQNDHAEYLRETAYEIIADEATRNRLIVNALKSFNLDDGEILKDIGRY